MNRQDFTAYIHDPYQPMLEKKEDLHDLTIRFPYCSVVHILYSLLLYSENDLEFNTQLKKTAAYLPSRKRLKELLDGFKVPLPETQSVTDNLKEEISAIREPVIDIRHQEQSVTRNDLIDRVKKRLHEIESEKEGTFVPDMAPPETTTESHLMSKAEIIEKFIHEGPRISSQKTSFFKPSEYALKSNIDDTDIVSETLAKLYLEQGNTAKAIQVYEKLCLLFPKKNLYFAAQIKKIR